MKNLGKIIIYYGKGEGKTSAALGRAIRMAGYGKRVIILEFMKGRKSGEYRFLDKVKKRNIFPIEINLGGPKFFLKEEKDYFIHQKKAKKLFSLAEEIILKKKCDLLVLDEILYALKFKLIKEKELLDLLKKRKRTDIILTGGPLSRDLKKIADQITKLDKVKHYFDKEKRTIKGLDF